MKIKDYLLSLSGVILAILLSAADYHVDLLSATFMVLTIIFLHTYSVSSKTAPDNRMKSRVFLAMTIICGLAMLHFSFGSVFLMEPLLLMVLGYVIIRAVSHTDFKAEGKGIIYVLLLFGLVEVYGTFYICTHTLPTWPMLFPAFAAGCMAVAAKSESQTLHIAMTAAGWAMMIAYSCLRMFDPWHFLFVLSLPLFFTKRHELATFVFALLAGGGFLVYLI